MSDPLPIQPGAQRPQNASEPTSPAGPVTPPGIDPGQGGPAFKALLERLSTEAQALGRASEDLASPAELSDAAAQAKARVNDAMSLGNDLLEAVRAMKLKDTPGA